MTFAFPLLLGGLALAGLPVLIHLIMRQKPKRLPFPAFRFLVQKHRTNQTRLRLRHLLLLLLRVGVVTALCLALARPALTGGMLSPLAPDRPVSAVLLIDTSYSMEYAPGGKSSRLDEARRRAGELLDDLPDGSQVAILDSAEVGGQPQTIAQARERIAGLKLRHANASLPRQIERAYALFPELDRLQENGAEAPHVLYVISDRTRGCWDEAEAAGVKPPAGVTAVFVDVGVDDPTDLAIVEVKPEPTTVRPGGTVRVNVSVQATGDDYDAALVCTIDGQHEQKQSRKVQAGRTEVVTFEYRAGRGAAGEEPDLLTEGPHQATVKLGNSDPMPFDDAAHATFRVLGARSLLVIADDTGAARDWAELVSDDFRPAVKAPNDLAPDRLDLDDYAAVCLFNVARPPDWLWARLKDYVAEGHGLAVVLGGQKGGPDAAAYNDDKSAAAVLPVRLDGVRTADGAERHWSEFQDEGNRLERHSLLAPFLRWKRAGGIEYFVDPERKPRVERFWKVRPEGQADVLLHYTDKDASPALVERTIGRGDVLVLTTALEVGRDSSERWNNFFGLNSFGFVFSHLMLRHLAGDTREPTFNYVTGQAVTVPLPAKGLLPTYTLAGPGVVGGDSTLTRQKDQRELTITQATTPGNFLVLAVPDDGQGVQKLAAFSLNPRPDEHILDRVPVEQIEALLGAGSVLPVGRNVSLRERLQERGGRPLELMPWLLIALLVFLALESLLANHFYRQPAPEEPAPVSDASEKRSAPQPAAQMAEEGR
jgi:hypothetical protein